MSSSEVPQSPYNLDCDRGAYDEEAFKAAIRVVRDVILDRDRLYDEVAYDYVGQTLTPQLGEAFAADAEKALGWITGAKAIRATVLYHNGEVMTRELLLRICWQISANDDMLQLGLPLSPRLEDHCDRWMIVDVAGVDAAPRVGFATLTFRALSGRAAGWSMQQEITSRGSYYIAGRLGFRGGARRPCYQFDGDVFKLFGLYFAAYLEDERVSRFACTDPLLKLNRNIIRMRHRGNMDEDGVVRDNWGNPVSFKKLGFGCPIEYTHECIDCPCVRRIVTSTSGHKPVVGGPTCGAAYRTTQ